MDDQDLLRTMTREEMSKLTPEERRKRHALRVAAKGTPRDRCHQALLQHVQQLRYLQPRFASPMDEADDVTWTIHVAIGKVIEELTETAKDVAALPETWDPIKKLPPKKKGPVKTPEQKMQKGSYVVFQDKKRAGYMEILGLKESDTLAPLEVTLVSGRKVALKAADGSRLVVEGAHLKLVARPKGEGEVES